MPRSNFAAWLSRPASAVAVVGAGGWIGRAAIASVLAAAPDLPAQRLRLFASRGRTQAMGARSLEIETLGPGTILGAGEWLIVHAGVVGGDASSGGEARGRNDELLGAVMAMSEAARVRRLILASSGAAGRVDTVAPGRTAYAIMKRQIEDQAQARALRTGLRLLVPRVFNLGGPFMTLPHTYALGDFILGLKRDGRIGVGASHPVFRSYVHVREMTDVLFEMALDDGEDAAPFDVGGAEVVELGALARRVARALSMPDAEIARPAPAGDPDWYVGDGRRYQSALFGMGDEPAPLDRIIADTIDYLEAAGPPASGPDRM